jgi:hypothetical protein
MPESSARALFTQATVTSLASRQSRSLHPVADGVGSAAYVVFKQQ